MRYVKQNSRQKISAIPTLYKGFHFRSRSEARWAVFFDTFGLEWRYEQEGFNVNGSLYLPDFWLPHLRVWFEVKGEEPTEEEIEKAENLTKASGLDLYFGWGVVGDPENGQLLKIDPDGWAGDEHWFWVCRKCRGFGISPDRRLADCECTTPHSATVPWGEKGWESDVNHVGRAIIAARSARFEHGQRGSFIQ